MRCALEKKRERRPSGGWVWSCREGSKGGKGPGGARKGVACGRGTEPCSVYAEGGAPVPEPDTQVGWWEMIMRFAGSWKGRKGM